MYIIIAGCRKVGSGLALELSQENHDVVIIDSDPKNFEALGPGFNGLMITGMPIDEDVLRSAGIEQADALAAVTNDDNMNIMISQIAKDIFKVPNVITRVYDPRREEVFNKMGINIICPTSLAVEEIKELIVLKENHKIVDFNGTRVLFKCEKPAKKLIGKKIADVKDESILGILKEEKFTLAYPQTYINAEDTLIKSECIE